MATATTTTEYGFGTVLDGALEEVRPRVEAALKEEGFGILTEIDVKATLKKKIDVDFKPYVILGACNPPLAHRALSAETDIGLMLPCNVVLYEQEPGRTTVRAFDPEVGMRIAGNPDLNSIGREAKERLERALGALG